MSSDSWENFRLVRDMDKDKAGLSANESTVLFCIAAHGNDYGVSFPSQETIAGKTGLSARSVVRAVKALVEAGFVTVTVGKHGNNIYRMEMEVISQVPTYEKPEENEHMTGWHLGKCQAGMSVVTGCPSKIQEDTYKTLFIASLRDGDINHIIAHRRFWTGVLSLNLPDRANGRSLN